MRSLVAILVLALAAWAGATGQEQPQKNNLESTLRSIESEQRTIRSRLGRVRREVQEVRGDIRDVDQRIELLDRRLESTNARLARARRESRALAAQLVDLSNRIEERQSLASRRLRAMAIQGSGSSLNVLFGARSLADFAARRSLVERIARRDQQLFEELRELNQQVEQKKARQERIVAEVANLERRQRAEQGELAAVMAEKQDALQDLAQQQAVLRRQWDELEAQSRRIEQQLLAFQSASGVQAFRGTFLRPVQGRVTSGFGMRIHPILRERRMHHGIDIAARAGTPILASAPGVVVSSNYLHALGNTVIIDHGGGVATVYAHASRLFVRAGQRVTRGQTIAAVGSTGWSTGPHLHFEIRINGRPIDPMTRL